MKHARARWLRCLTPVVSIALALAIATTARADLITLSLPGVKGDVTVAGYQGTIEVLSLTGAVENSGSIGSATGGAGVGKVTFGDLMIHKAFDTASPALFLAVVRGTHFPSAVVTFLQETTGNKLTKIFTMTLSEVFVTKFVTDATQPHVLAGPEQVNLEYGQIVLKDEVTGTTACFDRTKNVTC
jgi:type VI secretion system Hcp family effector